MLNWIQGVLKGFLECFQKRENDRERKGGGGPQGESPQPNKIKRADTPHPDRDRVPPETQNMHPATSTRNSSGRITGGGSTLLVRISILVFVFTIFLFLYLVLGIDFSLIWVKLKSMLLGRAFRLLFSRLLSWEVPLFVLCVVSGQGGSISYMMDPEGASASSGGSDSISVGGRSGGSSRDEGWTDFFLDVLAEPSSETDQEGTSVNQPGSEEVLRENPIVPERERAVPAEVFPYEGDELIGGDSLASIEQRLLGGNISPSDFELNQARIDAQDLMEVKAEIINLMAPLDPPGDWLRRGARALDNPRTKTGEESVPRLHAMLADLRNGGVQSQTFRILVDRVPLRADEDQQSGT